jgi:hypothetical protein
MSLMAVEQQSTYELFGERTPASASVARLKKFARATISMIVPQINWRDLSIG